MKFAISKKKDFKEEEIKEIGNVLTEAFMKNPLIGGWIYRNNRKALSCFLTTCAKYYSKYGEIVIAKKGEKIVGVALWNTPEDKEISVGNAIKGNMTMDFIRMMLHTPIATFKRLMEVNKQMLNYHYKGEHYYLFMLASIEKGSGREILEKSIEYYKGYTLYLESSVAKENHKYYKEAGFQMLSELEYKGTSNAFFIKK